MKHFLLILVIIHVIKKVRPFEDTICVILTRNFVEPQSSCIDRVQNIFYKNCLHEIWDTESNCFFFNSGKLHQTSDFTKLSDCAKMKQHKQCKIQLCFDSCDEWYFLEESEKNATSGYLQRNIYVMLIKKVSLVKFIKIFDGTFNVGHSIEDGAFFNKNNIYAAISLNQNNVSFFKPLRLLEFDVILRVPHSLDFAKTDFLNIVLFKGFGEIRKKFASQDSKQFDSLENSIKKSLEKFIEPIDFFTLDFCSSYSVNYYQNNVWNDATYSVKYCASFAKSGSKWYLVDDYFNLDILNFENTNVFVIKSDYLTQNFREITNSLPKIEKKYFRNETNLFSAITPYLLLVFDLAKLEISSLIIFNNTNNIYTKILSGEVNVTKITSLEHFGSAIVFNYNFTEEIGDLLIIVKVFNKSVEIFFSKDSVVVDAVEQRICKNSSDDVVIFCDVLPNTLSIPSLCGIGLTAILFKQWRRETGNQILLNFGFALSAKHFSSFCFEQAVDVQALNGPSCYIFGVLYHYFQLAHFSWMFVCGILQFKRLVIVFGGIDYLLPKACLLGWLSPVVPVVLLLISNYKNYEELCIPRDFGLIFAIWVPAASIIFCNAIIFLYIFYHLLCNRPQILQSQASDIRVSRYVSLAIILSFMLGINWAFVLGDILYPETFFFRLFTVSTSLQGFVLFLFLIPLNTKTRNMYLQLFKKWFRCNSQVYIINDTSTDCL
ncbi:uncharacterized protein LOC123010996 isoform X2 [Tribolium madens]|uniref:uncharacterized protein LOC123010996 isoform X2 n=1 Tax=Tribolium madens TaxID=41895 RepID=UPI001CF7303D|nr:uncharacterized protein LOC123010996 isoform X2 [Tribolium madens]